MKPTTLDLHVPKGWQMCTTRELEMIAEEMIRAQMVASLSRFHPFDWIEIKTRLFFRFSGVEVSSQGSDLDIASQRDALSGSDPSNTSGNESLDIRTKEQKRAAQQLGSDPDEASLRDATLVSDPQSFRCRKGDVEFELQTWQVHSFMEQLAWLDATDGKGRALPMPKMMFPYPERVWVPWSQTKEWHIYYPWFEWCTPGGQLLDGMTWQTYRFINDWMEAYTMKANAIVAEREKQGKTDPKQLRRLMREERDLRTTVLSLIFGCPKWRVRLARISEVEWQVCLFWWSSMMQYLKEQYPKCFKSSAKPSRSRQQPLPIELYTRSMATLHKYLGGLTEDEINAQTAHAILRHLNDMAIEAEEMEKLRRKHK